MSRAAAPVWPRVVEIMSSEAPSRDDFREIARLTGGSCPTGDYVLVPRALLAAAYQPKAPPLVRFDRRRP